MCAVYRPPSASLHKFKDILSKCHHTLSHAELDNPNVILAGDFNFPPAVVEWEKIDDLVVPLIKPGNSVDKLSFLALQDLTGSLFLSQVVDTPTRDGNILDLCFTNDPHSILHTAAMLVPRSISDHVMVNITTSYLTPLVPRHHVTEPLPDIATFNFPTANQEVLEEKIQNINWDAHITFPIMSPLQIVEAITTQTVLIATEAKVPPYTNLSKTPFAPPIHRRKLFRKRCILQNELALYPHKIDTIQPKINVINFKLQQSYAQQRILAETKAVESISHNPSVFFKYANSKRKVKNRIGPLKTTLNGMPHFEYGPKQMADILSTQYTSVFTKPDVTSQVLHPSLFFTTGLPVTYSTLRDVPFTVADIESALSELKPSSSEGPDGWPAFLLHRYRQYYAYPVYLLWRKSLDTGDMPEVINLAYISPLFKGGEKFKPVNYRPIALTSHLTKTFERVLRKAIILHLATHNLINNSQHGFTAKRSTMTQLIDYYTFILDHLDKTCNIDSVYLDFSKAFDKCDHGIILHKLKAFGVGGKVGLWVANFLKNRQQQVRIMGCTSDRAWVTSGVPQGSVLGPLLFSILISDIDTGIKTTSLLSYADDTKIFMGVTCPEDSSALQSDLSSVYQWAKTNNQEFNLTKFESITFSLDGSQTEYLDANNQPIPCKDHIHDLGITFSSDGSFRKHIDIIVAKANKMAGWVLRVFDSREKQPMLTLLKTLIIPLLEYCCPVWSPTDQGSIFLLEKVQRSFTKRIFGLSHLHYWDRLTHLKLYSLHRRRERYIVIYIWKILHDLVPNPGITLRPYLDHQDGMVLSLPHLPRSGVRKLKEQSLLYNGVRLFQSLPGHLRTLAFHDDGKPPKVDNFKKHLDAYLYPS